MKTVLLTTLLVSVWSVGANANEMGNDFWFPKGAHEIKVTQTDEQAQWEGATLVNADQVAANDVDEVDTHKRLRLNFISKRPYQHKVDKQEKWEGATLKKESIDEDGEVKSKSNINQFSRRPYMKRNVD
jgi:hypothetical protein